MGFILRLDDGRSVWIQCRYERVFHICFKCGCIGHGLDKYLKQESQVLAAIIEQKRAILERFPPVSMQFDTINVLFVPDVVAFSSSAHKRTTHVSYTGLVNNDHN